MRARLAFVLLTRFLAAAFAAASFGASPALASHSQVAILQDDPHLLSDPVDAFAEMRQLGVSMVRVSVRWSFFAPAPNSHRRPRFNALDSNAYPGRVWGALDRLVRQASARGIQVMLVPTGFAPLWAQGPNPGRYGGKYNSNFAWEPSAAQFGAFVHAVGARYSGSYYPRGSHTPLPRVSTWEIYNEPNFGEDLAPQAIDGSAVLYSPRLYRSLADAGWSALAASGHRGDTVVIGALAAAGAQAGPGRRDPQGLPGTYGETKPLVFIRELYCLDASYHRYLGLAAALRGCPATSAGYRRFRAEHPVLFGASGFSDHPYVLARGLPPTEGDSTDPSYAQFNQLPRFAATLDRIQRSYGSARRLAIWNTEYGYITCPPNCHHGYVSPTTAAAYINWAEYLSWRNPRMASTMQYLLHDPSPTIGTPELGGFASGLIFFPTVHRGAPKPGYYAYRMPIFLPVTRGRRGRSLEVWGDVRPATYALADGDGPQLARIQFAPGSSHAWRTVKTVQFTDPHGYFDTHVAFPSSGSVRISWTYPSYDYTLLPYPSGVSNAPLVSITSRTVAISLR